MKPKQKATLAMAAFLCVCLLPSLGMAVFPERAAAAKQSLAPLPSLRAADGAWNTRYLEQLVDYAADHFALRQEMITADAALDAALFRVSAEESVVLGRDGWLFYRETLDDRLHTQPMSQRQLCCAARTLALLSEYAESRGARFAFTVAPNKASLYPDMLPSVGEPLPGADDIDRLRPLLEREGVLYVDLFSAFRAREGEPLYYRTDSHWNERGAALARDTLLAGLGRDAEALLDGGWHAAGEHRGDLYEMLYPAGSGTEEELAPDGGFAFSYAHPIRSAEDQRIETLRPDRTGRLLMFRDSFGNSLHPYLADEWGGALFSRSMPCRLELLDEFGADTVLLELVERNLDYLTLYAPVFPAPRRYLNGEPPVGAAYAALRASDDGAPEGLVRLGGALCGAVDDDSPIYIQLGQALYEATPAGAADDHPFTLYVPREAAPEEATVLYLQGGALYRSASVERS